MLRCAAACRLAAPELKRMRCRYRGVKKNLASKFVRGESATFWSVTSTTFNVEVLQEEMFLGKHGDRTMFTIAGAVSPSRTRHAA